MDFLEMFTNQSQFSGNDFESDDLHKKELKNGDNTFRIVGKGRIFYTHSFDSKNNKGVSSICVKDEDGNGECDICKIWNGAWKVLNDVKKAEETGSKHPYSDDQVKQARLVTGDAINSRVGFKQSWGPKKNIALNVIDRDTRLNEKENHLSLLVKSEYVRGISAGKKSIYETLVKLLTRYKDELKAHYAKGHDWLPFDTILIKSGKGIDTDYDKEKGESKPLTEAELKMERYDLKAITKPTDAKIITRWLTEGTKSGSETEDSKVNDEFAAKANEKVDDIMPPSPEEKTVEEKPVQEKSVEEKPEEKKSGFTKKAVEEKKEDKTVEMDNCPTCDKMIDVSSSKCQHCGEEFAGYDSNSTF